MKLQEKIMFSDVLFEKSCVVEDTATSAEERPLPKEWHLPADISFILGKLAERRQSQTLLSVAPRKHDSHDLQQSWWASGKASPQGTFQHCCGYLRKLRNRHPWRCSEDTWTKLWETWTALGSQVHPLCSWGFGCTLSLGRQWSWGQPLPSDDFGEFPESSAGASARTDPLPQDMLLGWCSCPWLLSEESGLCLTMQSVDLDPLISFLALPKFCLVVMDLSGKLWTVAHPSSSLQTWSWCWHDSYFDPGPASSSQARLMIWILSWTRYLPIPAFVPLLRCFLLLARPLLLCYTPGFQLLYSFGELPALTAPSNLLWADSFGGDLQRSLPTQIFL